MTRRVRGRLPRALALLSLVAAAACAGGGGGGGGGGGDEGLSVVLLYSDEAGADDVLDKLDATGHFGTLTAFDVTLGTPSLGNLRAFDVVVVMAINSLDDAETLGDHLADYVDEGGGVVLCEYATNLGSTAMVRGRFLTDDYYAIEPTGILSGGGPFGLTPVVAAHPILAGVTNFDGGTSSARPSSSTLHASAVLVATWNDPQASPLVATRLIGLGAVRRADLGFYPATTDAGFPTYVNPAGDAILVLSNAVRWVAGDL
jgi:hypothetical protein